MNLSQNGLSTRAFEQKSLLPLREKSDGQRPSRLSTGSEVRMRGVSPSSSPIKGEGFWDSYMSTERPPEASLHRGIYR